MGKKRSRNIGKILIVALALTISSAPAIAGGLNGRYCFSEDVGTYWFDLKPDGTGTYHQADGYGFDAQYYGNLTIKSLNNGVEFYFCRRGKDIIKTGDSYGRICNPSYKAGNCVYHHGPCPGAK